MDTLQLLHLCFGVNQVPLLIQNVVVNRDFLFDFEKSFVDKWKFIQIADMFLVHMAMHVY